MLGSGCFPIRDIPQNLSKTVKSSDSVSSGSTSTQMPNSATHPYLPGFLMGDQPSPRNGYVSPPVKSPSQRSNSRQNKTVQPRLSGTKAPSIERVSRRHASPPTQSLWSSASQVKPLGSDKVSEDRGSVQRNLSSSTDYLTPNRHDVTSFKYSPLFQSPIQTPSNVSRTDGTVVDETDTWVTVFGFDQAHANFVLQHFSRLGTIDKYIIANGGNWMNIKYSNKIQARCALNQNGRVIDGKIMIGVRRCTDLSALNGGGVIASNSEDFMTDGNDSSDGREGFSVSINRRFRKPSDQFTPIFKLESSPVHGKVKLESPGVLKQSFNSRTEKFGGPIKIGDINLTRHNSMRPLAAPYQPPPRCQVSRANHFQSLKTGNSKSPGLLSKALDYVFGWN
ncbi:hypothetical protein Aperf_G00000062977 [Anoplocephala perfoliata]